MSDDDDWGKRWKEQLKNTIEVFGEQHKYWESKRVELLLKLVQVPTDVDEDEATRSVQQQLADAEIESDSAEARRIVQEARKQQ